MSMSGPSGGAEESDEGGLFTEMNVTPLCDIFLVLLIIFMVTATGLSTGAFDVTLPRASDAAGDSMDTARVVTLTIAPGARFLVNREEVPREKLEAAVRAALADAKDPSVMLAGSKDVPLDQVIAAADAAQKAGAKRVAIAVEKQP